MQWPTKRFNSTILFQNHEAFDQIVRLGETEYAVIDISQGTDSADAWITADPQVDLMLRIELRFSPVDLPSVLARWVSDYFDRLLSMLPRLWERSIRDIHKELIHMVRPNLLSTIRRKRLKYTRWVEPEDSVSRVLQEKQHGHS